VLSVKTPDRRRLHTLSIEATRNSQAAGTLPGRPDFKPIQAELGPVTKAACNYTK
jgi:hypothetical protein